MKQKFKGMRNIFLGGHNIYPYLKVFSFIFHTPLFFSWGNPAPEPPAALLVEFGDDYEDVARAFIDLHKDSFCKIEVEETKGFL